MKESLWGYWIVVLGISIVGVMVVLHNYTTTSEQDYYLIKEVLEASMNESVDFSFYRDTGRLKMNAEKYNFSIGMQSATSSVSELNTRISV